jgi:hypothetical protein
MPQYLFRIRGAEVRQNDEIGVSCDSDSTALERACHIVRELRAGGGYDDPRLVVDVLNELGKRVLSLPFLAAGA